MGRWSIINVFLGLMIVLLGIEIARTWARSLPTVEITQRAAVPPPEKREKGGKRGAGDKAAAHAEQSPVVLVSAIAEKDLFDVSRQKATEEVAKAAEVPKETGPPPGVTITGMRVFGKDREAFVTENGVAKRLRVGDQVAGYTVKSIDATGLSLTSPSGDGVTMPLAIEAGKAPAAGPPGKPPGPARPGQPPQLVQPGSPAAGVQTASPAAGIQPPAPAVPPAARAPVPAPAVAGGVGGQPLNPVAPGAQNPQNQSAPPLPNDVRQKLERLKQNSGNARLGRNRH